MKLQLRSIRRHSGNQCSLVDGFSARTVQKTNSTFLSGRSALGATLAEARTHLIPNNTQKKFLTALGEFYSKL